MRKIMATLILMASAVTFANAQDSLMNVLPMKEGRVYYEGIIAVEGMSKKMLYERAKRWAVDFYKSAKDVIQLDDASNGELTLKGAYKTFWKATFMSGSDVYVDHTIHISVKDGRYRYQISDFATHGYSAPSRYSAGGTWEYTLEKWVTFRPKNAKRYLADVVAPTIERTISSLGAAMNMPIAANQDW